jgi:hypothetical protein
MSDTLWGRLLKGTSRIHQASDWVRAAGPEWPNHIMALAVTDRFHAKQGRSTGRLILHAHQERISVYLKRHYRLPRLLGWLATIFPNGNWSPAMQEWEHLEWARRQGFLVPRAVAAAEWIGPRGQLQSVLAVEELAGMLPLHEAIPLAEQRLSPRQFAAWKKGLTREIAAIVHKLHGQSRFHKDLYLCHFYIEADLTAQLPSWAGRVFLIDLHRLGHHPVSHSVWQIKDLAQLLYSSEISGITDRDRLRFWSLYRQGRRAPFLERLVRLKWQRYRKHNRKEDAPLRNAA